MVLFFYWFLILFEFMFVIAIALYMAFLIYSSIKGSPYVPTKNKQISEILENIPFKKGMKFLDLGCGDGRVIMLAVRKYKVRGVGIDINPMIVAWARLKAHFAKLSGVEFRVENIFKTALGDFDIVYLFLMPELLTKLEPKLAKETKKAALIVSHGFKIEGWDKYCYKTLSRKPFSTYFYRLK